MARRKEPRWGWKPEQKWAYEMEERSGYFRKNALVVYRCRRGCLLGFAWPALLNAPPDRGDGVARRWKAQVTEPVFGGNPITEIPEEDWKFYAYRHIDPEIQFMGDPNDDNTVGWAPAGSIRASKQGFVEHWNDPDEPPPAYDDAGVMGQRDVVRDIFGFAWRHLELHPPVFFTSNPPGLVNCKHAEAELSHANVVRDMGVYHPRKPIILPYD